MGENARVLRWPSQAVGEYLVFRDVVLGAKTGSTQKLVSKPRQDSFFLQDQVGVFKC